MYWVSFNTFLGLVVVFDKHTNISKLDLEIHDHLDDKQVHRTKVLSQFLQKNDNIYHVEDFSTFDERTFRELHIQDKLDLNSYRPKFAALSRDPAFARLLPLALSAVSANSSCVMALLQQMQAQVDR